MKIKSVNAPETEAPSGGYSQAVEVTGATRTLYISGQIPVDKNGNTPKDFSDQARLAWKNVIHQLEAADMTLDNVVKHTTFLSSREFCDENSRIRQEILGHRKPALTVVIAGIYDESWLLEIEVIAAD